MEGIKGDREEARDRAREKEQQAAEKEKGSVARIDIKAVP